jgi:heat shock protein HtpX
MGHRHHNGLKTASLFAVLWVVLLGIGWLLGRGTPTLRWIFVVLGLVAIAYSYWSCDRIAIRAMQARPVSELEQPAMYRVVRELSTVARQPMPRLYVSPTMAPNAFATGRDPANAAVCCTDGILAMMDERELRGVLGHELMHVYNRDILTSSVAAAVAGVITSLAQVMLFFGGGSGRDRGGNPLAGLLLVFLAPLAAMLIQLAITRTRELSTRTRTAPG